MRCQGWRTLRLMILAATLSVGQVQAQQTAPAPNAGSAAPNPAAVAPQIQPASVNLADVRGAAAYDYDPDSLQAIVARLEAAEAELAELRAQQTQAKPKSQNWLASMQSSQQSASGTSEQNVEGRIANLEREARENRERLPFVRLSGFFQEDTGWFNQDSASHTQLGNIQNGTGFRRARLQAIGKVSEFTNYSIEMDFAWPGRPSFMDVWGEQTNLPLGTVRIGQYRQPVTMDGWTSIRHLEFLEQSAPFYAFDPYRRVGVMDYWHSENQRTMVAASVYASGWTFWNSVNNGTTNATQTSNLGVDNRFGTTLGNGAALALRATHLLWYDEPTEGRYLMHVGGGYNPAQIGNNPSQVGGGTFRAATIPEFFVGDQQGNFSTLAGTPQFLDTGRFKARDSQLFHTEWAMNYGSFHVQTEWLGMVVGQDGGPPVLYDGAYAQCGYFLTGESAGYNKQMAALDYNCQPFSEFFGLGSRKGICGWGAWEVAARWSYLDLQSGRIKASNYVGTTGIPGQPGFVPGGAAGPSTTNPNPGVLNEATLALNWYWNQFTRVQFNIIFADLCSQYVASPTVSHYSLTEIYTMRYQIEF
ncbi:MAG TPA: porin [Pirellulales bacterium]|nr:porin [Pirellulales bacterium]